VGKASSSKKVQRAARAAASSRGASERRELGFPLTVAAVVVLGVALVVAARWQREPPLAPTTADHWHAAYAVYDCDSLLGPFPSERDTQGIHSHADGVIHIHPFGGGAAGDNAQLEVFLDAMGVTVTPNSISGPGLELDAGSDCNGEPTVIRVARFDPTDLSAPPDVYTDDFGSIRFLENLEAFTIARVPDGADIPPPPDDRIAAAASASGETTTERNESDPAALSTTTSTSTSTSTSTTTSTSTVAPGEGVSEDG
jgi:hypothetical protein